MGTSQRLLHSDKLRVELGIHFRKDLSESPYLSLYLNNDLSWATHIDKVCTKLFQKVTILGRIKSKVPKVILEQVYNSLI